MHQVYHFIRRDGEVKKSVHCHALKFFRPDQLIADAPLGWGNASDGAQILGYSILKDALGEDVARSHYNDFMKEVLVPLELDEWKITKQQLAEFCDYHSRISGMAYQGVVEGMNPANWDKPTDYRELPSLPSCVANMNHVLAVPAKESLAKN